MRTNITYRKLSTGNYLGRCGKYYLFIRRRPHGKWNAIIGIGGEWLIGEGYHTTSLPTIPKAKAWIKTKLSTVQTTSKQ